MKSAAITFALVLVGCGATHVYDQRHCHVAVWGWSEVVAGSGNMNDIEADTLPPFQVLSEAKGKEIDRIEITSFELSTAKHPTLEQIAAAQKLVDGCSYTFRESCETLARVIQRSQKKIRKTRHSASLEAK